MNIIMSRVTNRLATRHIKLTVGNHSIPMASQRTWIKNYRKKDICQMFNPNHGEKTKTR